jgi:sarcosine oxidase/L-pipecolate oxidase
LLALEAMEAWSMWNTEVDHPLFVQCGWARINERGEFPQVEIEDIETMERLGLRESQYRLDDLIDRERAMSEGLGSEIDPFAQVARGIPLGGVFDSSAGFVRAADACTFTLKKIKRLGVNVVGGPAGSVVELLQPHSRPNHERPRVMGVRTEDGQHHYSDVVIVAAGAYSHALVPS